jgi:hypothetical protein
MENICTWEEYVKGRGSLCIRGEITTISDLGCIMIALGSGKYLKVDGEYIMLPQYGSGND